MSHSQSKGSQSRKGVRSGGGPAYQHRAGGPSPALKGGGSGGPGPSAASTFPSQPEACVSIPSSKGKHSNDGAGQPRAISATEFVEHSNPKVQPNPSLRQQLQAPFQTQSGVEVVKQQPPPRVPSSNGSVSRSSKPGIPSANNAITSGAFLSGEAAHASMLPTVPFQFGSITPGFMHNSRMQMPFRTSSAPPNLDEQMRDQVRFGTVSVEQLNVPNISCGQSQQQQQQQQFRDGNDGFTTLVTPVSSEELVQLERVNARQPNLVIEKLMQTSQMSSASITLSPTPYFSQQSVTVTLGMPTVQYSQGHGYSIPLQYLQANSHIQQQIAVPQAHLQMQAFAAAQAQHQALAQQSIAPPSLAPQQGIIQQAPSQTIKFQQPMLSTPHANQMMVSSLTHVPAQLQPQQIPSHIHPLGSHLTPAVGTQLQAVQYLSPSTNQQIFIQPRTNKAVKIVHPDTHEELKFDARSKKADGLMDSSLPNTSGLSGGGLNSMSQVRASASYSSGIPPVVNPGGFYAGHSGGGSYSHTSQPYYPTTGLLKPSAGGVKSSSLQPYVAQTAASQSSFFTSIRGPSSKMGHSNAVCSDVSDKLSGISATAIEGSVPAKNNCSGISNLTSSTVEGGIAVTKQVTSTLTETASAVQTTTGVLVYRSELESTTKDTKVSLSTDLPKQQGNMFPMQITSGSESNSAGKDERDSNMSLVLSNKQGSTLPSVQKTVMTTEIPLQSIDVKTTNATSTDHHSQSRSNCDTCGPIPTLIFNSSVTDPKRLECSSMKQVVQLTILPQENDESRLDSLQPGISQGPIDKAADVLQEHLQHCGENRNEADDKLTRTLDLEASKSTVTVGPHSCDTNQMFSRPYQNSSIYIDTTMPVKESHSSDTMLEASTKRHGGLIGQQSLDSDRKSMIENLPSDIRTASSAEKSEVNKENSKYDGEQCKIPENSEFKIAKGSDLDSSVLDKIRCSEVKQELRTIHAAVGTDVKSSGNEDKDHDIELLNPSNDRSEESMLNLDKKECNEVKQEFWGMHASVGTEVKSSVKEDKHCETELLRPSDDGSEESKEMEPQLQLLVTLNKTSNSYNGRDAGVALQQQWQQQHDDASLASFKPVSIQHPTSSTNVALEVKQSSKKKKKKDILARADAAGSSTDLYNAYKAPEKKKAEDEMKKAHAKVDTSVRSETKENTEMSKMTFEIPVEAGENLSSREVDDWEDGAEVSLPKVRAEHLDVSASVNIETVSDFALESHKNRKYTRDFLLTFRKQHRDLPSAVDPELLQNLGRDQDRQLSGGPRLERHGSIVGSSDEQKWAKQPGVATSSDNKLDMGVAGFRPGAGMNQGLIARAPAGLNQNLGSVLIPGATMLPGSVRGADSERWQHAPPVQKGLIPSPQTPVTPMHKAEKKYEVGRISDEEQGKQRQIKGILNKLTPQNFDRLIDQVKEANIETAHTLTGVISQIFDKALMEPFFCEMYAKFCVQLAKALPEFNENGTKITFKRVLLNNCQEEFEKEEREEAEANRPEEDGEVKLSLEERDAKRVNARRRMLGNIRFIGELYKKSMLTERIMHECMKKLSRDYLSPDEEDVEALCKLMRTIGQMIDHSKAKDHVDSYFDRMLIMSDNQSLPSRIRFMLKDVIDLRKSGWKERMKVDGPKKIEEVHRDAAQERQNATGRFSRGSNAGTSSGRRATHIEEPSARGSSMSLFSPPSTTGGGLRSLPQPLSNSRAGHGQDRRVEDKLSMDNRPFLMPLSQRLADDLTITLGPQGGLGRGMPVRGQPGSSGRSALAELSSAIPTDRHSVGSGGFASYSNKDDISQRVPGSDRPIVRQDGPLLEKPHVRERCIPRLDHAMGDMNINTGSSSKLSHYENAAILTGPTVTPDLLTEEQLQKKIRSIIDEFYSIRDFKEASLCVEDLKSPYFHSTMVSIWVLHSFERKDTERDLLVNLLISFYRDEPFLLQQDHIVKGYEIALSMSEETFIDVPKAPEYLALMFEKLILEEIIPLAEVGRLLKNGGMEPGSLVQTGDSINILLDILEAITKKKGQSAMLELYRLSVLHLEDFVLLENIQNGRLNVLLDQRKLQCLYPMMSVEQCLSELLEKDETPSEVLKWLEMHSSTMQSEPSFLRMVMGQVLRHIVPTSIDNYKNVAIKKSIQLKMNNYAPVLKHFASATSKVMEENQRQYIVAVQLFMNDLGYPAGLMPTLFSVLYEEDVICESAFFKWQDDIKDPTPKRDEAIRSVGSWLHWLSTPEDIVEA